MRILLVSHGFPPSAAGGAEIYAHAHALELARGGDNVFVLTREADSSRPEYVVRRERRDGIEIAWINNTFRDVTSFRDSYRNERVGEIAAELIAQFSPEAAHVHHLTCLSTTIVDTLRSRDVPVFCTLHDYWFLCHRGQLLDVNMKVCAGPEPDGCGACIGPAAILPPSAYAARGAIARMGGLVPAPALPVLRQFAATLGSLKGSDAGAAASRTRLNDMRRAMDGVAHFFAPSRSMRDRFVAFGIDPDRISVSEYGLAPMMDRPQSSGQRRPLRVGFLGSLMASKAPHLLIEACAGLPADSVTVDLWGDAVDYHGDDRYRSQLRAWLDRPGVRAHGKLAHGDVAAALARIDVLAVTSIWPENSPLVIREAFLAGVPVVASRIGGIPETVEDNVNGLLFEPGSAVDLRRVLSRLLDEPELLPRLQGAIPPVRTLASDVASMRERYVQAQARRPHSSARRPRLAAVVLNYRTPDDTFLAARSVLHSTRVPDEVIVVDNDSSNHLERGLQPIRSRVSYLQTGGNLGFSGGMNAGIQDALARGAERILLINSDVILASDCIAHLERAIEMKPGAGIAGPVLMSRHAPDTVTSAGVMYDARTGRMRNLGAGTIRRTTMSQPAADITAVTGSVMMVTRETFEKAGLLEPDYFFSFEDIDFCLRARALGLTSVLVNNAIAFHEGGQSIGSRSPRRLYFGARNHLLLAHRSSQGSSVAVRTGRAAFIVGLNLAHAAARARGGTVVSRVGAVLRGTRDYVAGRFGADSAVRDEPA